MKEKAWIVALDMGYGHGRAADPLKTLSPTGKVIHANNYPGMPSKDFNYWSRMQHWYELISRLKRIPVIGTAIFGIMDSFQKIPTFRPGEKDGKPTIQLKKTYQSINKGLGKHLIAELSKEPYPIITTFFTVAYMAEVHNYPGDIYLVICDSDVSRAWAPIFPDTSRVTYCVPTAHVAERLKTYGVRQERIILTGFPIAEENIGKNNEVVKRDLLARLHNLDPENVYAEEYKDLHLKVEPHELTLTYAIGGAGAQKQIGARIIKSIGSELAKKNMRLNIMCGTRADVRDYYKLELQAQNLEKELNKTIFIYYYQDKVEYFKGFNELMHETDILWTKPSELVFYTSLGIPVLMSPSIGSQEDANQSWLESIGAGISECDPDRTHEWLFEWLESGVLAQTALNGYRHGILNGVGNITKLIKTDHACSV